MLIYNGEIKEDDSWVNRSFKYGDGLFETIRIYQGQILFWEEHMDRLLRGMEVLKMEFQAGLFQLMLLKNAQHLIKEKGIEQHGRLRIQVFRSGKGAYGPIARKPSFLIEAFGFEGNTYHSLYPISLTSFYEYRLFSHPLNGCKTANAIPYILAALHAQDEGFDEALLFTQDGYVSEASSANVFLIHKQQLLTPPLSSFCLDGVMRKKMIELSQELKIPLVEKKLKEGDVKKAEAIFLTNSTRGIIPIRQFQKREVNSQGHPMVVFLRSCLEQFVEKLVS